VADEPKIKEILTQAHAQNLLFPSSEDNTCLLATINTANHLLFLLSKAQGQGLDVEQISKRSQLHPNTCKVFLRVLVELGYVSRSEAANKSPIGAGGLKAVWHLKE
jgi:predicted ArsR family transcriptional regulator